MATFKPRGEGPGTCAGRDAFAAEVDMPRTHPARLTRYVLLRRDDTLRLILLIIGCIHAPVALAPSTGPVPTGAIRGEWRTAKRCDAYLFGFIPMDDPTFLQGVITDTGATADRPLVSVTVDRSDTFWLIGTTRCTRVSGWLTEAPAPAVVERPPSEQARAALFSVYARLGASPSTPEARELDLRAVARALDAGVTDLVGQVELFVAEHPGTPVFQAIARILDSD